MKHFLPLALLVLPLALAAQLGTGSMPYSSGSLQKINPATSDSTGNTLISGTGAATYSVYNVLNSHAFPQQAVLTAYPNPAITEARAVFSTMQSGTKFTLLLISAEGRPLLQKAGTTVTGTNSVTIGLDNYPTGTYYLQLYVGNKKQTLQLLKVMR